MKMIEITARRDGVRRGGIAHHGTQAHPTNAFSAEQLDQIRAEPLLAVREYDGDPVPAPAEEIEQAGKSRK